MAVATLAVSARRAAVLLRCQQVRERRCRAESVRAEGARLAADAAEREAIILERTGADEDEVCLQDAHAKLVGHVIGPGDLGMLPSLQQAMAARAAARHATTLRLAQAADIARAAADATRAMLVTEMRKTESRSALADRAWAFWRRAAEAAEEVKRDDEVADTWRST